MYMGHRGVAYLPCEEFIIVEQSPYGIPVSDFEAEILAASLVDAEYGLLMYSTENIFHAIRVLIGEGKLSSAKIMFKYEDTYIPIMDDGRLRNWPSGFCVTFDGFLDRLLDL